MSSGKLKTRPACLSCIVASGLDPAGICERIVCSVCRGTGVVQLAPSQPAKQAPSWLLVAVCVLVSMSVTFFGVVAYFSIREEAKNQGIAQQMREQSHRAACESAEAMRQRIHVQMLEETVRLIAGDPDKIEAMSNGDSTFELWHYQCGSDHVQIAILDGKVQSIKQ